LVSVVLSVTLTVAVNLVPSVRAGEFQLPMLTGAPDQVLPSRAIFSTFLMMPSK
jgi:hypothetical protein